MFCHVSSLIVILHCHIRFVDARVLSTHQFIALPAQLDCITRYPTASQSARPGSDHPRGGCETGGRQTLSQSGKDPAESTRGLRSTMSSCRCDPAFQTDPFSGRDGASLGRGDRPKRVEMFIRISGRGGEERGKGEREGHHMTWRTTTISLSSTVQHH